MTRYTSLGIKRTFVEAGFDEQEPSGPVNNNAVAKSKKTTNKTRAEEAGPSAERDKSSRWRDKQNEKGEGKKFSGKGQGKEKYKRVLSSEDRRQRRIADRNSDKICFACRAKGHAAKDCPSAVQVEEGKSVVGICYRCGSNKHTLKRCKKQADPSNPMPFASCFVCSGTGHLASTCPQNAAKGVYPNGGSCKLCGETTHLAKDCGLRKQASVPLLGTGQEAGADEDDFHTFKRRKVEVDEEERKERRMEKLTRQQTVVAGPTVPGVAMKPAAKPKKVVSF